MSLVADVSHADADAALPLAPDVPLWRMSVEQYHELARLGFFSGDDRVELFVVVRGSDDDYPDRHPGPRDVPLLVEVSDTTLHHDQSFKKAMYAKARIAAYWIVNLADRRLEVYGDPSGPGASPD